MDNQRLKTFQQVIKSQNLDASIVTNPTNIFYLTGFRGVMPQEREAILVISPKPILITARLYQNEATRLASKNLKIKIVHERHELASYAAELLKGLKRIGFEENDLRFAEYHFLVRSSNKTLIPSSRLIANLRIIKSAEEIRKIEKAQIISQKAFGGIVKTLKVGQTEDEIAQTLASIIKNLGGQGLAFESIVASGPNSGIPHHVTGRRKIKRGDVLLFDFGAKYQDYCADLSRVVAIGKAKDEHQNIHHHVLKAQKQAIEKITHGIKASDAYHAANNYFKKHKLQQYFLHGLGHGIGLEVHEAPYLRPNLQTTRFASEARLAELPNYRTIQLLTNNMVFSVEPGLYFPWGGVRIEDLVVIQNGQAKVLGKLTKEIIEI